jgi:hypothetical protein
VLHALCVAAQTASGLPPRPAGQQAAQTRCGWCTSEAATMNIMSFNTKSHHITTLAAPAVCLVVCSC